MIASGNSATAAREGELIWLQICDCSMQKVKIYPMYNYCNLLKVD